MFENLYLNALVIGAVIYVVALTAGLITRNKIERPGVNPWLFALVFGLFAAAITFVVSLTRGESPVYVPFLQWLRVREIGYKAIWLGFAKNLLPFSLAGFFVAPVFKKTNTLGKATLWAIGSAIITAVATLIAHGYNSDAVVGAFLGTIVGFGIFAFLKLFFTKTKFFREPTLKRKTHIGSLTVVFVVYFACVALIMVDSGGEFEQLNIFTPDTQLPSDISCEAELSNESLKMLTYSTVTPDPKNDILKISESFSMNGELTDADSANKRATIVDGSRVLTINLTGEWKYTDSGFIGQAGGQTTERGYYENLAVELTKRIALPFSDYRVTETEFITKKDAAGVLQPAAVVHMSAYLNGLSVQGSCELAVTYWYDGTLCSFDKYSSDFEPYKEVTVISQANAWEKVLSGGAAHTLWNEAQSAKILSVEGAYWLEEIRGFLHPIWMFKGIATNADGSQVEFNIFVPAMQY